MPLTDTRIKAAKPKAKRYRLNDGQGLKLEVTPAGGRFWRYRYRIDGKENLYTIGKWNVAPDGETTVVAARTPSDHRGVKNMRAQLRRAGLKV